MASFVLVHLRKTVLDMAYAGESVHISCTFSLVEFWRFSIGLTFGLEIRQMIPARLFCIEKRSRYHGPVCPII